MVEASIYIIDCLSALHFFSTIIIETRSLNDPSAPSNIYILVSEDQ